MTWVAHQLWANYLGKGAQGNDNLHLQKARTNMPFQPMPISKLLSENHEDKQSVAVNESAVGCTTTFSSQQSDSFTSPPSALFAPRRRAERQDRDAGLMRHLSGPTVSLSLRTENPLTQATLLGCVHSAVTRQHQCCHGLRRNQRNSSLLQKDGLGRERQ